MMDAHFPFHFSATNHILYHTFHLLLSSNGYGVIPNPLMKPVDTGASHLYYTLP